MSRIYFDYASTTPVDPDVITAMTPYMHECFGNVSSPHAYGREAQKALEEARESVAALIGANSAEVVFNSGATESNNHAIIGTARALKGKGHHMIVSSIEHHSVLEAVEYLKQNHGYAITYISVDANGLVNPNDIEEAITDRTVLIAVMYANNEIGVIQPVADIGAIARERHIPFLVDAVQAVGHLPVNVRDLKADFLSLSAHKMYGPKGVGALYVRDKTKLSSLLLGGDQERARRASTQNVAGAVGLSKAVALCVQKMNDEQKLQTQLRDVLLCEIPKRIKGAKINGHKTQRLPNNAHFSFDGVQSESLLMKMDIAGMAASMGSACTSGAMEPSHVLRALGLSDDLAYSALRITLGRWTTKQHVDALLQQLPEMVTSLRI